MNSRGRIDEKTNIMGMISGFSKMEIDDEHYFEFGLGGLYKDGYEDGVKVDEIYFNYNHPAFGIIIGKKQKPDLFNGLSATGHSILWSLNATPPPGIQFYMNKPWFLMEDHGIGFKVGLEEYLLDDKRYIDNTRLHHKTFHLVYTNKDNLEVSVGIQHYVQWDGISEEFGKLPGTFNDYIKVFTGSIADNEVGREEVNALGNQIGSYEINVKTKIQDVDFHFIYNTIFDDGSGMKMGNFPDGRYAVYFEDNRDTFWGRDWLKKFMYEFYYTKNQSRDRAGSLVDGADNYFNNNLYRSGWTYQNRVIGIPFILLNEETRFRIGTNILTVHHLGISGEIAEYPYRFLLSYRKNYGLKDRFFINTREIFSSLLEVEIINSDFLLKAQLGADIKNYQKSNFGVGLNISKELF
ncbi:capsule assembly Wzi family protein [Gramella sp. AN32]|uniref:Capsule assembly Wzi family protein n=1 Tax=Christiangramia antarctica TaxID=2058158 RepID=A0ABW5X268_9FLAO|nr:capsule assembly Wzi family protein [Gramella sp. AN32]